MAAAQQDQAVRAAMLRARALKAVATRRARMAASAIVLPARSRGPAPQSLCTFLVRQGGIRDPRGDLLAVMGKATARPGLLNNRTGRSLDRAAQLALEAGYFPEHAVSRRGALVAEGLGGAMREGGAAAETMTPAALLTAIDLELRGKLRRYPNGEAPERQAKPDPVREEHDAEAEARNAALAWEGLRRAAEEEGIEGVYAFLARRGVLRQDQEIPF